MKTLPLLLLWLACLGACASSEPRAPAAGTSRENQPMRVIPLQYAAAAEVSSALRQLWPDARVVADERTNSVVVCCATEAGLRQLSECIAQLDVQVQAPK